MGPAVFCSIVTFIDLLYACVLFAVWCGMPSSQSLELHTLYKGKMPVVSDTHENQEGIAEHSFSINGDVGLSSRFCTVQAEEVCVAFGCVKGQSRLIRSSDLFIYFWL